MDWQQECQRLQKENAALKAEIAKLHRQLAAADMASVSSYYELPSTGEMERKQLGLAAEIKLGISTVVGAGTKIGINAKSSPAEKIRLFREFFHGREDVYARRWASEKTGKSGYSPVCQNEWDPLLCNKGHVKCAGCPNRQMAPLTDAVYYAHLAGRDPLGRDVLGLYPITPAETCWFLALDFDDGNWQTALKAVQTVCRSQALPALAERSRSRQGGHLWLFFTEEISCRQARELGTALLAAAMEQNRSLDFSAFDRMFPNQDTLPKGGFGNLIALPLQGQARRQGNSVFIDEDGMPFPDQWARLAAMTKITPEQIKESLKRLRPEDRAFMAPETAEEETALPPVPWEQRNDRRLTALDFGGSLMLVQANGTYIQARGLSARARSTLLKLAAFGNPAFYRAQAMRLSVHGKPRVICCAEEKDGYILLPRGCDDDLRMLLKDTGVAFSVTDKRQNGRPVRVRFMTQLRPEQQQAAQALLAHQTGILCAATAFGKTVVAASLIADRQISTLILVHTQALLNQWKLALEQFLQFDDPLDLPPKGRGRKRTPSHIGLLGGTKNSLGGRVDIAIFQSLTQKEELPALVSGYGMVIVDECHHVSAVRFEQVLRAVRARYVYGLTATPTRQDGHQPIIRMQCGPIRWQSDGKSQAAEQAVERILIPRFTRFALPVTEEKNVPIMRVYTLLAEDERRNRQITEEVLEAVRRERTPLVLTERYAHALTLTELLRAKGLNVWLLSGQGTAKEKREKLTQLNALPPKTPIVLVATGKYIGEGFDFPRLDTLFLAMPVAWKGTVTQYAGRLHRDSPGKRCVVICDYIDVRVPVLERMYHKRSAAYRSLGYGERTGMPVISPEIPLFYAENDAPKPLIADIGAAQTEIVFSCSGLHPGKMAKFAESWTQAARRGARTAVFLSQERWLKLPQEKRTRLEVILEDGSAELCLTQGPLPKFCVIDRKLVWYGDADMLGFCRKEQGVLRLINPGLAEELLEMVRSTYQTGYQPSTNAME